MTIGPQSQCDTCLHFRSAFLRADDDPLDEPFCAAFPAGIPEPVYGNQIDHRQPIDGDHGVRWTFNGEDEFPTYAFRPETLGKTD